MKRGEIYRETMGSRFARVDSLSNTYARMVPVKPSGKRFRSTGEHAMVVQRYDFLKRWHVVDRKMP